MKEIKSKEKESSDEEDASINTTFTSRTFFNETLSMQPSNSSSSSQQSSSSSQQPEHSNIIRQAGEMIEQREITEPDANIIPEIEKVSNEQSDFLNNVILSTKFFRFDVVFVFTSKT